MSDEELLEAEESAAAEEGEEEPEEKDLAAKLKEAVQVEVADAGTLRKRLTVSVPRETIAEQQTEQFDELSRDALVPGFRKGRAPRKLIIKRFGRDVNEQLKIDLLTRGYLAAVDKADLRVLGDPMICLPGERGGERLVSVEDAFDEIDLPAEGSMRFVCEVEVRPRFELPALEGIELKKPMVEITDEDVDAQIDRLRGLQGTFEPVIGKVKEDDLVVVDLKLSIADKEAKSEENVQLAARPQVIEHIPVETLGEALIGKKAGDRAFVEVVAPQDHPTAEWRGQNARLELLIHDIKRLSLPELDERFLSDVGFDSAEELRKWVRQDMTARLGETIRDGLRNQACQYLLENTSVELPEGLSHRQAERVADRRLIELRRQGVPEADIHKRLDELRVKAKDDAVRDLKLFFIMEALAEKLEIHVGEDEVNGQIALMAQRYGRRFDRMRDELAKGDGLTNLYLHLRDEKIVDWLITKARITETPGPDKTAAKRRTKTTERPRRTPPPKRSKDR